MASLTRPLAMSKELAKLKHEKKNKNMQKLPPNATIERRPLSHPSIASPLAGAHIQKVVYVSRRTPVMSAVKRVKKLLSHIEKRALQSVDMLHENEYQTFTKLSDASDKLKKSPEEVLVKASGRAMEQALRVGEWFQNREAEILCVVEIRTGSVAAIDDIVEKESHELIDTSVDENQDGKTDGGDTSLDLLGHADLTSSTENPHEDPEAQQVTTDPMGQKRRRKRKCRTDYDEKELPEARLRWVKTVEVAISLKA